MTLPVIKLAWQNLKEGDIALIDAKRAKVTSIIRVQSMRLHGAIYPAYASVWFVPTPLSDVAAIPLIRIFSVMDQVVIVARESGVLTKNAPGVTPDEPWAVLVGKTAPQRIVCTGATREEAVERAAMFYGVAVL